MGIAILLCVILITALICCILASRADAKKERETEDLNSLSSIEVQNLSSMDETIRGAVEGLKVPFIRCFNTFARHDAAVAFMYELKAKSTAVVYLDYWVSQDQVNELLAPFTTKELIVTAYRHFDAEKDSYGFITKEEYECILIQITEKGNKFLEDMKDA